MACGSRPQIVLPQRKPQADRLAARRRISVYQANGERLSPLRSLGHLLTFRVEPTEAILPVGSEHGKRVSNAPGPWTVVRGKGEVGDFSR